MLTIMFWKDEQRSHHVRSPIDSTTTSRATTVTTALTNVSEPDASSSITTPSEYLDPRNDPSSLQTTLSSLLPHDELGQVRNAGKAFHEGWREGPITFLP